MTNWYSLPNTTSIQSYLLWASTNTNGFFYAMMMLAVYTIIVLSLYRRIPFYTILGTAGISTALMSIFLFFLGLLGLIFPIVFGLAGIMCLLLQSYSNGQMGV